MDFAAQSAQILYRHRDLFRRVGKWLAARAVFSLTYCRVVPFRRPNGTILFQINPVDLRVLNVGEKDPVPLKWVTVEIRSILNKRSKSRRFYGYCTAYLRPKRDAALQFHRKSSALHVFSGGGTIGSGQLRFVLLCSICCTVWPNDCRTCCTLVGSRSTSSKAFTGRVVGDGSPANSFKKYNIAFDGAVPLLCR